MSHRTVAFASLLGMVISLPALAQSSRYHVNGLVSADLGFSSGTNVQTGLVDLSFGIAPEAGGSFGGLGFEFGVYGYAIRSGGSSASDGTLFAALTFDLGGGRLHVGVPRSAAWGYTDVRIPGGAISLLPILNTQLGIAPFSTTTAVNVDRPVLGVTYERQSGNLRYSVGIGRIDVPVITPTFAAFGIEYSTGRSRAYATLEYGDAAGSVATQLNLGASTRVETGLASVEEVEVGFALTHLDTGPTGTTSANLFATAQINDRLSATLSVLHHDVFGSQTLYGVNANYEVWDSVMLNAGYADGSPGSGLWTLGLSRRF